MKTTIQLACLAIWLVTACSKAKNDDDESADEPAWYQPTADTSWHIQLTGTINTTYDVDAYDIDLFDSSQDLIDTLHDNGSKIICYFSAGSSEDWREDHKDIPAAAIGKAMDGWPGENWLDIRREDLKAIMLARMDVAVAKKCDAVDPDNVNGYTNDTGFPLTAADQLAYNRWLAESAHSRGLGIALKNDGAQIADLADVFDMSVNEQCHMYNECQPYYRFVELNKPVFNIEYELTAEEVCSKAKAENFRTLVMPDNLDGTSRTSCD